MPRDKKEESKLLSVSFLAFSELKPNFQTTYRAYVLLAVYSGLLIGHDDRNPMLVCVWVSGDVSV